MKVKTLLKKSMGQHLVASAGCCCCSCCCCTTTTVNSPGAGTPTPPKAS